MCMYILSIYEDQSIDMNLILNYTDAKLEAFGSSCNGFGFRDSDLDLCLTFTKSDPKVLGPILINISWQITFPLEFNLHNAIIAAQDKQHMWFIVFSRIWILWRSSKIWQRN